MPVLERSEGPKFNISEKTAALLPQLIAQAGITNPVVGVDETKTLIRVYLLGHAEPVIIKKPKTSRRRAQRTRTKGSKSSQETQASAKPPRCGGQQTRGKNRAST